MWNYKRIAQYHETDKMGVIHHSNYVKWMEEARISFLSDIGLPFVDMEELGIVSPVVSVQIQYKNPVKFGDEVTISLKIKEYNGIKLIVEYKMEKGDVLVVEASSSHCFLKDGKIISLARSFPKIHEKLKNEMK